jgi:hypothetical protein
MRAKRHLAERIALAVGFPSNRTASPTTFFQFNAGKVVRSEGQVAAVHRTGSWPVALGRFRRKQIRNLHSQSVRQDDQFRIGHPSQLRFNFGERRPAQLQTQHRTARCKHFLRQAILISQASDLRANNIAGPFFSFDHAPDSERKPIEIWPAICSIFGAIFCQTSNGIV